MELGLQVQVSVFFEATITVAHNSETTVKFFSIPCLRPKIHHRVCTGSYDGWLINHCGQHLQYASFESFHQCSDPTPFDNHLILHRSIKFIMGQQVVYSFGSLHHLFFHKAILSSTPDMLICNVRCQLAFARARDKAWTSISTHYGYARKSTNERSWRAYISKCCS